MWKPISFDKLTSKIEDSEIYMSAGSRKFWDYIKIYPEKWDLHPWGDAGDGFWVVAVMGKTCIYYNDIEEGFNISSYKTFGKIDEYLCNQSDLLPRIDYLYNELIQLKTV